MKKYLLIIACLISISMMAEDNYSNASDIDAISMNGFSVCKYNSNNTKKNRSGAIKFNYSQAGLYDEVVKSIAKTIDLNKERNALMALYNATDGEHWIHNENWGSDKPVGEWYGISTNSDGSVWMLDLSGNGLRGQIPEEISDLTRLKILFMAVNEITGPLPESIGLLKELYQLNMQGNKISGSLPESIGNLTCLIEIVLNVNEISGEIPSSIGNLRNLKDFFIQNNHLSGSIPKALGNLSSLEEMTLANNELSGCLPEELGNLLNIEFLALHNNQLTGNIPESFANLENLEDLWIDANNMDGVIPESVINSEMWKHLNYSIKQRDGHKLTGTYQSKDYSMDGEVTLLQAHTKGNGVKLVILGDAFSDRLISDGTYESQAKRAYGYFFEPEPYNTFKDYFDVYLIKVVSPGESLGDEASMGTYFSEDGNITFIPEKVKNYVQKISEFDNSMRNVTVLLFFNSSSNRLYYNDVTAWYEDGFSIATSETSNSMEYAVKHEACGHGFGKLEDEYLRLGMSAYDPVYFPEEDKEWLDNQHLNGYALNVDYHSTPETVLWKDFLSNPNYEVEEIGIYEGAMRDYSKGIFRPSKNSRMNYAEGEDDFNAPSRWAIYKRIKNIAGEACTFEEFLEYDKKNIGLTYKLTYIVDGEVYKSYDIEYGSTITPEAEPTKDGYIFSGWSEIPATMPAHDVTVTGTFTLDTGIEEIMSNANGDIMIFTIDGKRVDNLKKGMNVIRMKDGTTRKVVVK